MMPETNKEKIVNLMAANSKRGYFTVELCSIFGLTEEYVYDLLNNDNDFFFDQIKVGNSTRFIGWRLSEYR